MELCDQNFWCAIHQAIGDYLFGVENTAEMTVEVVLKTLLKVSVTVGAVTAYSYYKIDNYYRNNALPDTASYNRGVADGRANLIEQLSDCLNRVKR